HLLQWNRAGDQRTKDFFAEKVAKIRSKGSTLKEQLRKQTQMNLEEQAVFYSDWSYSAVRLACALPNGGSVDRIAQMLNIPDLKVAKIVAFLLKSGLCKLSNGRLTYNVFSTYVDSSSPFAKKLHDNWRMRSIQYGSSDQDDLMFTSAVTLTPEDFLRLRDQF